MTTNTTYRSRYFISPEKSASLAAIIQQTCLERQFTLFAYCILPDHVHLLVERRGNAPLSKFMKDIKGRFWRSVSGPRFWQPRYNFRIIENENRFAQTINYVQYNYRKMDLPEFYGQPPFIHVNWAEIYKFWK